MSTLTQKAAKDLIDHIDFHNKNLTKKQIYLVDDLKTAIKLDEFWNAENIIKLHEMGYSAEDIDLIQSREKYCKFECGNEKITIEEARGLCGRDKYLSGLARACFHWSAMAENGEFEVYFDMSEYFNNFNN